MNKALDQLEAEAALVRERAARAVEVRWNGFVSSHDVACASCGYNLRGLQGRRCPECGGRIDPAALMFVGPDLLSVRAFMRHTGVVGAVATAAATHLVGLVVAPSVYASLLVQGRPAPEPAGSDMFVTVMLLVIAACAWGLRRAMNGRPDATFQPVAAGMCWGLAGIKLLMLVLVIVA